MLIKRIVKIPALIFIFLGTMFTYAFGSSQYDYFRTVNSGNWNSASTWQSSSNNISWVTADRFPSTASPGVTIRNGHTITVTADLSMDDLLISSGGKLIINTGKNFNVMNGAASVDILVLGSITNQGIINTNGVISFGNGGVYQHNYTTTAGVIPTATWQDGSLCEIIGYTSSNANVSGINQNFYNLYWNCPGQLSSSTPNLGIISTTVRNDFNILNTGGGGLKLSGNSFNLNLNNFNIFGGLIIINNISGTVSNINISGDFSISGGTLSKAIGTGIANLIFKGSSLQTYSKTGGNFVGIVNFTVNANAILATGSSVFDGSTGNFTVSANATIQTAHPNGIALTGASGTVQTEGGRSFSTAANYVYNGSSAQITGTGLPATVNNLSINNNAGVTLRSGSLAVNGTLDINAGSLNLGVNLLTTSGVVGAVGSGTLFTQNTSANPLPANKSWAGTVTYNATGSQTIVSGDYNNLVATGGGRVLSSQINIAGTFTPGDPNLYTTTGSTINFNGAGAQNIPAFNFNNLTCSTSGTKTITGEATVNNSLAVNNSAVLNANGSLTLLATATSNANVAALSGSADIIGNVNVQSYLYGEPSGALRGTKSMSSPINDAAVVGAKTFEQLKNYIIITGYNGVTNGFDAGPGPTVTFNPTTINFYVESASPTASSFVGIPSLSTNTTPGTGFLTFFRGNRSGIYDSPGKLKSPFSAAEDVLVTYTGPINKGDINVNVGYTNYGDAYDGFYLAGNPYPATIDWDALRTASLNMGSSITIVTGGKANATYNAVGGVAANGGSRYIQPGQGFYVQANSGGGILRFKENQKNIVEAPARLLSLPTQPSVVVMNNKLNTLAAKSTSSNLITNNIQSNTSNKILRMTLKSDDFEEETVVVFDDQFSDLANENDSKYFPGFDVSLATLSADNKPMAINLMPDVNNVTDIKLSITAKSSGNMELNFGELSLGYLNNLWLEDSYLNTIVQVNQGSTYNFSIDKKIAASYGNNRLKILVAPPTTLAVTYTKFDAKKVNQGVALQWSTVNENNNKGFEVERAADKEQIFTKIAFIPATDLLAAEANYSYLDENPLVGNNYYRLKQIDNNGKFDYSSLKYVNFGIGNQDSKITLYPNPTSSYFKITGLKDSQGAVQLNILNLNGAYLKKAVFSVGQELKQDVSTLPNGMYLVEVLSNEGVLLSLNKFIKN